MEPFFATIILNLASSIIYGAIKPKANIKKQIEDAFEITLIEWSPNKNTRESIRRQLKNHFNNPQLVAQNFSDSELIKYEELEIFAERFKFHLASHTNAFIYIKELIDQKRHVERKSHDSNVNEKLIDITKDLKFIVDGFKNSQTINLPSDEQDQKLLGESTNQTSKNDQDEHFLDETVGVISNKPQLFSSYKNPFKHLEYYDVEDHNIFFGRDETINTFIKNIEKRLINKDGPALLQISGVSGSGKSSLMRAGIIGGILKSDKNWIHYVIRPLELVTDEKLTESKNPLIEFFNLLHLRLELITKTKLKKHLLEKLDQSLVAQNAIDTLKHWLLTLNKNLKGHNKFKIVFGLDQFEELLEILETDEGRLLWKSFLDFILTACKTGFVATIYTIPSTRVNQLENSSDELKRWDTEVRYDMKKEIFFPSARAITIFKKSFENVNLKVHVSLENKLDNSIEELIASGGHDFHTEILPHLSLSITKIYERWTQNDGKKIKRNKILTDGLYKSKDQKLTETYQNESEGLRYLTDEKYGDLVNLSNIINEQGEKAITRTKRNAGPAFVEGETLTNLLRRLVKYVSSKKNQLDLATITIPEDLGTQILVKNLIKNRLISINKGKNTIRLVHESVLEYWKEAKEWKLKEVNRLKYVECLTEEIHGISILKEWELNKNTNNEHEVINKYKEKIIIKAPEVLYAWSSLLAPTTHHQKAEPLNIQLREFLIEVLNFLNSPREKINGLEKSEPFHFQAAVSSNAIDLVKKWIQSDDTLIELIEPLKKRSSLFVAAFLNRYAMTKILLENGVDANTKDVDGWYPVQAAATRGHTELVKLYSNFMDTVNVVGAGDISTLMLAARIGHIDIVKYILDNCDLIERKNQTSYTPLIEASSHGHVEIVKLLLKKNSDYINQYTNIIYRSLFLAIRGKYSHVVEILLKYGAKTDFSIDNGLYPFQYATYKGHTSILKLLIAHGVNINVPIANTNNEVEVENEEEKEKLRLNPWEKDFNEHDEHWINKGWTALHLSIFYRYKDITELLLNSGAAIDALTSDGETCLHLAVVNDDVLMTKLLLENIKDGDAIMLKENHNGNSAFFLAIELEQFEIANLFINKKININSCKTNKQSLIGYIAKNGSYDQFVYLLNNNININRKDLKGESVAFSIINKKAHKKLNLLLEKDNSIILQVNKNEVSLLQKTIENDDLVSFEILMNSKENDLTYKDINGLTPLHYVSFSGNLEIATSLLENIENDLLNEKDKSGWTPIHYAAYHGHLDIITLLINKGAFVEPSKLKSNDFTPLQAAVQTGQLDIIKVLIDSGADIDRDTLFENNLLYLAVKNRQFHIANYLFDSTSCFDRLNESERKKLIDIYQGKIKIMNNAERIFREKLIAEGEHLPEIKEKQVLTTSNTIEVSNTSSFIKNINSQKATNGINLTDQIDDSKYDKHLDESISSTYLPEKHKIALMISRGNISNYTWFKGNTNLIEFLDAKLNIDNLDYTFDILDTTSVHFTCLSWYKNALLIKLSDNHWKTKNLNMYFILQDGKMLHRLDGTSPAIHALNSEIPIQLDSSNAMDYLKFFCFFVRGDEGPFYVLDDLNDPFLPENENVNKIISNLIYEKVISEKDVNNEYATKVLIYYSSALFEAQFKIHESGVVSMVDDEPVAADLPVKIEQPI
ncbi:ankyrin repeat domain-containing protein [Dokdonia sp.]|uniref:ankyrin repeat domain-containing protein n=1 Tax=Dokdonia sp. TaxID=2024995 RepID=UPI00326348EB